MILIVFILCCLDASGIERLTYSRNGDNLRFEWDDNSNPGQHLFFAHVDYDNDLFLRRATKENSITLKKNDFSNEDVYKHFSVHLSLTSVTLANGDRSNPSHLTTDYVEKPDFLPIQTLPVVQKVFGTSNFTDGFAFQWLNPSITDAVVDDIVYLVHILDEKTMNQGSFGLRNKILTKKSYFTVRGLKEDHPYIIQIWTVGYKDGEFFKNEEPKTVFTRTLSDRDSFVTCDEYLCSQQASERNTIACGEDTCKKNTECFEKFDGECPEDYNCRVHHPFRWYPGQKQTHECGTATDDECRANSNCCFVDDECFPRRMCPRMSIPNGYTDCGLEKCEVKCNPGFYIVGDPFPTCRNREWSHIPSCAPNLCEPLLELIQDSNGKTKATCTNGNNQNSRCEISCKNPNSDTRLVGASSIECTVRPDTGKVAWVKMRTKEPVHSGTVALCLPVLDLQQIVFEETRKCDCSDTAIEDEQFCDGKCDCQGCIDETYKSCLLRSELGLPFPIEGARTSVTIEIVDLVHSSLEIEISPTEARNTVFLNNENISGDLVCDSAAEPLANFNFCDEQPQQAIRDQLFTKIRCVYKLPDSFTGGTLTASYESLLAGSAQVRVTSPQTMLKTHTLSGESALIEWNAPDASDSEILYYEIVVTLSADDGNLRKRRSAGARRETIISATQTHYRFAVQSDEQYQFQAVAVKADGTRVIVVQTSGEHESRSVKPAPIVSVSYTREDSATFEFQDQGYEYLGVRIRNRLNNYQVERSEMTAAPGDVRTATIDLLKPDTSYSFSVEYLCAKNEIEKLKVYSEPASISFRTKAVLEVFVGDVGSDYLVFNWTVDGIATVELTPDISPGRITDNSVEFTGLSSDFEYGFSMTLRDEMDDVYYQQPERINVKTLARVEDFDIIPTAIRSDTMDITWPTVKDANGELPISERFTLSLDGNTIWVCHASPCSITGLTHSTPYYGSLKMTFNSAKSELSIVKELETAPRAPGIKSSEIRSTEIQIVFDSLFGGVFTVSARFINTTLYTRSFTDPDVTLGGLPADEEIQFASFIKFSPIKQTNTFPVILKTNPLPKKLKVVSGNTNSVKIELDEEVFARSVSVNLIISDYTSADGEELESFEYTAVGLQPGKEYKAETAYRWANEFRMINPIQSINFTMTTDKDFASFTTANEVGPLTFEAVNESNMTISWEEVENAESYELKYFIRSSSDRITLPDQYFRQKLTTTRVTVPNLIQNKVYGFQVMAFFPQNFISEGPLTFEKTKINSILPYFDYDIECRSTWIRVEFTTDYDRSESVNPPLSAKVTIKNETDIIKTIPIDSNSFQNPLPCDDSCTFSSGEKACSENSKFCILQDIMIKGLVPSSQVVLEIDVNYASQPGESQDPQNGITRFLQMSPSAPVIQLEKARDTSIELEWSYNQEEWDSANPTRVCHLKSSTSMGTEDGHNLLDGSAVSKINGMLPETPYEIELYCSFQFTNDLDDVLYKTTDSVLIENADGTGPTLSGLQLERVDSMKAYGKWNTPEFSETIQSNDEYRILVSDREGDRSYISDHTITTGDQYTSFETANLESNKDYALTMQLRRIIRNGTSLSDRPSSHRFEQWTNTQTIDNFKTPRRFFPEVLEIGSDYIRFGWQETFEKGEILNDTETPVRVSLTRVAELNTTTDPPIWNIYDPPFEELDSSITYDGESDNLQISTTYRWQLVGYFTAEGEFPERSTDVRVIEAKTSSNPALVSASNVEAGNVTISIDLSPAPDTDSWYVNIRPTAGGSGQSASGEGGSTSIPTFGDLEPGETYQVTITTFLEPTSTQISDAGGQSFQNVKPVLSNFTQFTTKDIKLDLLFLIDGSNEVDLYKDLVDDAETILKQIKAQINKLFDASIEEKRETREAIVNSNATIFNMQKEFIRTYLNRTNSVNDEEVQIAYQIYETDSFKRFGPRKRLRDVNGNLPNEGELLRGVVDEWKYEGGSYNPGEALYFAGVSFLMDDDNDYALFAGDREQVKNAIIMTMSNTGGIPSTVDKEISLLKGLRTVQFCTKAEILVIGLHDETDDRGDDQVFEEYMNLVGCWGHGDTAEDIDNIDFDNFACTDGRCPYPDEDTYTRRIQNTKITTCENVFRMPKSKDGIPDLISSIKRRIVQLARDDESAGLQDKYIFDEIHTKEKRKFMCEEFNKKLLNIAETRKRKQEL